jgi:hypothetical protein
VLQLAKFVQKMLREADTWAEFDADQQQENLPKVGDLLRRVISPANKPLAAFGGNRVAARNAARDPEVVIGKVYWVSPDGTQIKLQDKYGVKDPQVYDVAGFQKVKTWFNNGV